YGAPQQAELGSITAEEAGRHLRDGQFPPGSMGPKVEAALAFLAGGGELAVITSPGRVAATLSGEEWAGTRIERSPSRGGQGPWASRRSRVSPAPTATPCSCSARPARCRTAPG